MLFLWNLINIRGVPVVYFEAVHLIDSPLLMIVFYGSHSKLVPAFNSSGTLIITVPCGQFGNNGHATVKFNNTGLEII